MEHYVGFEVSLKLAICIARGLLKNLGLVIG